MDGALLGSGEQAEEASLSSEEAVESPTESRPRARLHSKRSARTAASPGDSLLGALAQHRTSDEPKLKKQKRSKGKMSALAQLEKIF